MGNLFADGAAFLSEQMHAHAASTVTYRRDALSVELSAVVGRAEGNALSMADFVADTEQVDFILVAAELILGGDVVEPALGDTIEHTKGGTTYVYRVVRDDLDREYVPSDEHGYDIRVHTVLKGPA